MSGGIIFCSMILAGLLLMMSVNGQSRNSSLTSEPTPDVSNGIPDCTKLKNFAYMWDSADCRIKHRCIGGEAYVYCPEGYVLSRLRSTCTESFYYKCAPGYVFSSLQNTCVKPGSMWDDCSTQGQSQAPRPLTAEEQCKQGKTVFAHPDKCHHYYNCSEPYVEYPFLRQQMLKECPYPQLFNDETLRCEDFRNVTCGNRTEAKTFCEYFGYGHLLSRWVPCWFILPSCVNIPDGPHKDPTTGGRVECLQERTVSPDVNLM